MVEDLGAPLHTTDVIVPGFNRPPYQEVNEGLLATEDALDGHVSHRQIAGHFKILKDDNMKTITRSDGPQIRSLMEDTSDQLVVYPYQDSSYGAGNTISYTFEWDGNPDGDLSFILRDMPENQRVYFIVKGNFSAGTTVQGSDEVSSLGQLISRNPALGTAHFRSGTDIHVMMSMTDHAYHPQVDDLATINHRVFWDGIRIRRNGSGRDSVEGVHHINADEFRPFIGELEPDFGAGVADWRENPVKFVDPLINEEDWLAYINSFDPIQYTSTSQTVGDLSGLSRWSDGTTWTGSSPGSGTIVVIKNGEKVVLDQTVQVKGVIIAGQGSALIVEDRPGISRKLTADYVLAVGGGMFQAGTESNPLDTDFTLELTGDDPGLILRVRDIVNGSSNETVTFAQ